MAVLSQSFLCTGLNHTDQLDVFRELALQPVARHEMGIKVHSSTMPIIRCAEHDIHLSIIIRHRSRYEHHSVATSTEGPSPLRDTKLVEDAEAEDPG